MALFNRRDKDPKAARQTGGGAEAQALAERPSGELARKGSR